MNRVAPSLAPAAGEDFNVAVCLHDPTIYSQTFVRRHIETLFDGRTVVVIKKRGASYAARPTYSLARSWRTFLAAASGRDALIEFLTANRVRFVLAEFGPLGVATYRSVKAAGLPMYCYFRGYDASKLLRNPSYVSKLRVMCQSIDGVVAVSEYLLNNLASVGVSCRQKFVIPSGVDVRDFSPGNKRAGSFIAVGRFIEKKAPQITIRAFARCLARNPSITLDMIGDGPELERARELCMQLEVGNRIRLHGALGHASVKEMLKTSSYFLQHSITASDGDSEGMPSAIQEAMACGCVVISTDHAGIPEHVQQNVTGVLVDENDEEQFGNEIQRLISNPILSESIAQNARAYAEQNLDYRMLQARLEDLIAREIIQH